MPVISVETPHKAPVTIVVNHSAQAVPKPFNSKLEGLRSAQSVLFR